jgi:hypothetical protein
VDLAHDAAAIPGIVNWILRFRWTTVRNPAKQLLVIHLDLSSIAYEVDAELVQLKNRCTPSHP